MAVTMKILPLGCDAMYFWVRVVYFTSASKTIEHSMITSVQNIFGDASSSDNDVDHYVIIRK
jgi:hypothetical protein